MSADIDTAVRRKAVPAVYVFAGRRRRKTERARAARHSVLLHVCENPREALLLAQSVRLLFQCPAWVADLFAPADADYLALRARGEAARARGEVGV